MVGLGNCRRGLQPPAHTPRQLRSTHARHHPKRIAAACRVGLPHPWPWCSRIARSHAITRPPSPPRSCRARRIPRHIAAALRVGTRRPWADSRLPTFVLVWAHRRFASTRPRVWATKVRPRPQHPAPKPAHRAALRVRVRCATAGVLPAQGPRVAKPKGPWWRGDRRWRVTNPKSPWWRGDRRWLNPQPTFAAPTAVGLGRAVVGRSHANSQFSAYRHAGARPACVAD